MTPVINMSRVERLNLRSQLLSLGAFFQPQASAYSVRLRAFAQNSQDELDRERQREEELDDSTFWQIWMLLLNRQYPALTLG